MLGACDFERACDEHLYFDRRVLCSPQNGRGALLWSRPRRY
jgi:hypothetical protein